MAAEIWVSIKAHCRETGDTAAAIHRRILSGEWGEQHFRRTERGDVEISPAGYSAWVEGEVTAALPAASARPTALYRCFDAQGRLLYVGISMSSLARLAGHVKASPWMYSVTRVEIEWLADRGLAAEAERLAIQRENPVFNLIHARK